MSDDPAAPAEWQQTRKGDAKAAHDKAAPVQEPAEKPTQEPVRSEAPVRAGSDMVRKDAPAPAMHPTGPMRDKADRAVFNGRITKEQRIESIRAEKARHEYEKSLLSKDDIDKSK